MAHAQASVSVGASPVAADRRHTYLIFETSDGRQTVVRGGPDASATGNQVGGLVSSTVFGSDDFGNIRVDSAPYVPPIEMAYKAKPDGGIVAVPADKVQPDDKTLQRDAKGHLITNMRYSPDWPLPGETHEHIVVWRGSDEQLKHKLDTALQIGQQINQAQLEYSPLFNNSNGVTSNLLKAMDIHPLLPLDKDGRPVNAPDFGQPLYQNVGVASHLGGYSLHGMEWRDENNGKIAPPKPSESTTPSSHRAVEEGEHRSLDSKSSAMRENAHRPLDDSPLLNVPGHPGYPLFQQAQRGIYAIDDKMGRKPDIHSERAATALAVAAKQGGLDQIDCVLLSDDGGRAFAVQRAQGQVAKMAFVDTLQAVNTSVAESSALWQQSARFAQLPGASAARSFNDPAPQSPPKQLNLSL